MITSFSNFPAAFVHILMLFTSFFSSHQFDSCRFFLILPLSRVRAFFLFKSLNSFPIWCLSRLKAPAKARPQMLNSKIHPPVFGWPRLDLLSCVGLPVLGSHLCLGIFPFAFVPLSFSLCPYRRDPQCYFLSLRFSLSNSSCPLSVLSLPLPPVSSLYCL